MQAGGDEGAKGRGRGFGDRQRGGGGGAGGRGGPRGPPRGGDRRGGPKEEWQPVTKLGRLVKAGYIKSFEEIYTYSLPIKEVGIVDHILQNKKEIELKDEVMKIKPVQKQTKAGQRTRFKAVVAVGDMAGHIGLGVKLAKEVQLAIRGALSQAKQRLVPIKLGWWGNKIGNAHTVPCKVTGKGGSVRVRLVPAPRGTGIVAAPVSKKLIQFAGVGDVFTSSSGSTKTMENFAKATYDALSRTYQFLMPEMWEKTVEKEHPFIEFTDQLQALADNKQKAYI